jgi:Yip1 domain
MTQMQTLAALITNPRSAFAEIERSSRFSLPMVLLLAANIGVIIWFYMTVDVDALVNGVLSARPLNAAQRAQAAGLMTRNTLMGSALLVGILGLFVIQLVEAFYFYFIFTFFEVQRTYRQWFAFTWWCSLPELLTAAATAVMLLFNHSSGSTGILSPLSLNQLFFHFDQADSGYSLLNSLTLVQLLTIALMVIGAHLWSKRSWVLSFIVVILPRLVVYGLWGWFVFRR